MNDDLDPLVETVLRQARAAVEPEPRQLAQALGGVLERLSRADLEDTGESEPAYGSGARGDVARPTEWLPSTSLLKKPLVFWSWGALTAAAGFALGVQYERRTAPHPAEVAVTVPHPAEITVPAPSAAPSLPSAAPEPTPPGSPNGALVEGRSKVAEPALGPLPEPPAAPPTQSRAAPRPRAGAQKEAPNAAPFEFRQVLDYVRRAERAERQGEPALALALLDELDQRADSRTLREERLLTRVLASCAQGDRDQAQRAARALTGMSGESIYTKRLANSCVNETE